LRSLAVLITAFAASALGAGPASATVTSVYSAGSNSLVVSGDSENDSIAITCVAGDARVNGAAVADPGNVKTGLLACADPGSIEVDAGEGADVLDIRGVQHADWATMTQVSLEGGGGADTLYGSSIDGALVLGTLSGGPGEDVLVPGGETAVNGGPGNDLFQGLGAPSALLDGGGETDTIAIDFSANAPADQTFLPTDGGLAYGPEGGPTTNALWASIERFDAVLDDGAQHVDAAGFSGSVHLDGRGGMDTLIGGPLADELLGGDGDDLLEGGGGNDVVDGAEGADTLRGGEDDDTLEGGANADVYAGGAGDDLIRARDDIADGGDCGPGHDTLIADAIDALTGCEVVDLPSVFVPPSQPPPSDPGPTPLPRPDPIPLPKRNPAAVKPSWKVRGDVTTITRLRVAGIADGSVLELRCSGRKCPFTNKRTAKARKGVIDGLALLAKPAQKRLRAGQTLEVRVTAPGHLGKVLRYKLRKDKQPRLTTLCLPVGKTKPQARC
jgi:hypothetical protein